MTTPTKTRALGKGLESLLPSRPAAGISLTAAAESDGTPLEIDVEKIERNRYQTRTHFDEEKLAELATSIKALGVVQPIIVRKTPSHAINGHYELINGERRWLASKLAGLTTVPAIVREVSNAQAMEMTIVENLQRADLNPMEQAYAFSRLSKEFFMTQEQMAERTGKDRASIGNFLRLLKLPESVQKHLETGALSFGHARALLSLDSPEAMEVVAERVLGRNLSVRSTETFIQGLITPASKSGPVQQEIFVDPNVREAQDRLQRSLGLKVTIEDKNGRGKVIIEYGGIEDFDVILAAVGDVAK
jgi:ParB family chromosome partitioning protein